MNDEQAHEVWGRTAGGLLGSSRGQDAAQGGPGAAALWGDMVSRSMCGQPARPQRCPYQAVQPKGLEVAFTRHRFGAPRQTLTNKSSWKICRKLGISTGSICLWRGCSGRCEDPPGPSKAPSSWRSWIHCSGPGGPLSCLVCLLPSGYGSSGTRPGCWPRTRCSSHPASWFLSEAFCTCTGTAGSKHRETSGTFRPGRGPDKGPGLRVKPTAIRSHRKQN